MTMAIFARSDLCYVGISRDHGGCGVGHGRPVIDGAPAKIWALICQNGCEDYLRSDPLWSITPTGIPETPDEKTHREDVEKRGSVEQAQSTASALEQLAKLGALPEVMSKFMEYMTSQSPAPAQIANTAEELQLCKNGHQNRNVSTFCSDCGVSLKEAVSSDRGLAVEPPTISLVDDVPGVSVPENLDELSTAELRDLAKQLDVKTTRSREDQITVIRALVSD